MTPGDVDARRGGRWRWIRWWRCGRREAAELRAIAAQLPAVVGRRAMIRALVGDAIANPNKSAILRRGWRKTARFPSHVRVMVVRRLADRSPPA